jgi:hypothetical protein
MLRRPNGRGQAEQLAGVANSVDGIPRRQIGFIQHFSAPHQDPLSRIRQGLQEDG